MEITPELDDSVEVDIRPEDIEMQVYRSSGAGGQHINKTSSRRPSCPQTYWFSGGASD